MGISTNKKGSFGRKEGVVLKRKRQMNRLEIDYNWYKKEGLQEEKKTMIDTWKEGKKEAKNIPLNTWKHFQRNKVNRLIKQRKAHL